MKQNGGNVDFGGALTGSYAQEVAVLIQRREGNGNMFQSDYRRFAEDFAFLEKYGFHFSHDEHHNVMPSVVFTNGVQSIQIGMHYEDKKMFVILYNHPRQVLGENLLDSVKLDGTFYREQRQQVIEYLDEYARMNF